MKLPALHTVANTFDPDGKYEYVHLKDGFAWVTDMITLVKYRLPQELSAVCGRIHFDQWRVIAGLDIESFTLTYDQLHIAVNFENQLSMAVNLLPYDEEFEKLEAIYDRTIKEPLLPVCVLNAQFLSSAMNLAGEYAVAIRATEKTVVVTHEYFTILIAQIQREPYGAL